MAGSIRREEGFPATGNKARARRKRCQVRPRICRTVVSTARIADVFIEQEMLCRAVRELLVVVLKSRFKRDPGSFGLGSVEAGWFAFLVGSPDANHPAVYVSVSFGRGFRREALGEPAASATQSGGPASIKVFETSVRIFLLSVGNNGRSVADTRNARRASGAPSIIIILIYYEFIVIF